VLSKSKHASFGCAAQAAFARLSSLGAVGRSAEVEVGGGIRVATVFDPFGNIFGMIQNPHFKLPDP